mmetsp:Transcript_124262/g.362789  ORF Transcript_124262/g.362789 Transcript_124262/m.362789 type:complete len:320 (-) Transcript_124262:771-1730(-)
MLVDELEVKVFVKMLLPILPALDDLVWEFTLQVHEMLQHVVVGLSRKENLACEQLKQCCTHGKCISWRPILGTQADLRSTIEAANQVGSLLNLGQLHCTAQIADLHKIVPRSNEDVVRLDVCVEDATPMDMSQAYQQLLGVGPNGLQRHALVLGVLLQGHAQVVPHALEDEAQVPSIGERPEQADDVLLVAPIGTIDPLQKLDLLLSSLPHHVIATHDLDGYGVLVLFVLGLDHIGEHALAAHGLDDPVAPIHDLTDGRPVVALLVVPVVGGGARLADGGGLVHAALQGVLVISVLLEHVAVALCLQLKDEAIHCPLLS